MESIITNPNNFTRITQMNNNVLNAFNQLNQSLNAQAQTRASPKQGH